MVLTRPEDRAPGSARFVELDALRGIAALAVLALHFTTEYDAFFPSKSPFPWGFPHGGLGVQLFFLISGFVIFRTTRKYRTPGAFAKARVLRLYPTYWACLILTTISTLLWPVYRQPLRTVLVNATMLQSFARVRDLDGAYWSLAREISFYVLIAVLLAIGKGRISSRMVTGIVTAWVIFGLAAACAFHLTSSQPVELLIRGTAAEFSPLFGAGMVLAQLKDGERRSLLPLPALAGAAGMTYWLVEGHAGSALFIACLMVPGFALVALRANTRFLQVRLLVWFGTISYPLYLLHQNIGHAVISSTKPALGAVGARVVAFAGVVALAWLVHVFIEERLGRALNRRLNAPLEEGRRHA